MESISLITTLELCTRYMFMVFAITFGCITADSHPCEKFNAEVATTSCVSDYISKMNMKKWNVLVLNSRIRAETKRLLVLLSALYAHNSQSTNSNVNFISSILNRIPSTGQLQHRIIQSTSKWSCPNLTDFIIIKIFVFSIGAVLSASQCRGPFKGAMEDSLPFEPIKMFLALSAN